MRVTFGLGSNLGDRLAHLQAAVHALASAGTYGIEVSPIVETDPVGGPEQPDYLNVVARLQLPGETDLWALADTVEQSRGRTRTVRFGPRTLDVDVLDAGFSSDDPRMTLPHPRAHERAFVLVPWVLLDPDAVLSGHGRVADLLAQLPQADRDTIRLRPDLTMATP